MANPHSEERMKLILKQMLDTAESAKAEEDDCDTDEVSLLFYGDHCNFGKTAKCKSSKCGF